MGMSMFGEGGHMALGRFPGRGNIRDASPSERDDGRVALGDRSRRTGNVAANPLAEAPASRSAAPVLAGPAQHRAVAARGPSPRVPIGAERRQPGLFGSHRARLVDGQVEVVRSSLRGERRLAAALRKRMLSCYYWA